jgi:hypothetical protein
MMKEIFEKYIKTCPKTGRIRKINYPAGIYKLFIPIIGFVALLWIVFRVTSKPSRINYPCVKAAAPFASGFLFYIASFVISALAFWKTKKRIFLSPYFAAIALMIFGFSGTYLIKDAGSDSDIKLPNSVHEANAPTGEGKGIFPGRVVWVYDPNATNENCNPTEYGHAWWMAENNDQVAIDSMVSKAIQSLTGKTTDKEAWDAIFKYHNNTRDKGSVSYASGEKIFIKINNVSGWGGNFSTKDLSVINNGSYGIAETSPEIILSVLRQLVNEVGVAQTDIYIGDPIRNIYKHSYDMWHDEFPNVHYVSHDNYTTLGREQLIASTTAKIYYSDKGTILRPDVWYADTNPNGTPITEDYLYQIYEDVEYVLNIPMLKGHKRAGVTMFAKNHFGSHTRSDASHLHNGLVDPIESEGTYSRRDYGMYRVQVDMMGHKLLGGKTLFYLMDALWPADQEISYPKKFQMAPFNNDYMSSIFASLDPVAIESVGYDFLRSEFTSARNVGDGAGTYVQKPAADDYLHQASDTTLWPADIKYDPNNTSIHLKSLGTHEHWNNATQMQYSRNLGLNSGIELLKILNYTDVKKEDELPAKFNLSQNYPNPFNPVTIIEYSLPKSQKVNIKVYDVSGREVAELENSYRTAGTYKVQFDAKRLASGIYFYRFSVGHYSETKKLVLLK